MKTFQIRNKAIDIFSYMEKVIPSIGMAGLTILVAYGTILRYFFDTSILGMEEVAILMALYCYLLGAACASSEKDHIKVNVLDEFPIPLKIRWAINMIVSIISVVVTGAFAFICILYGIAVAKSNLTIIPLGISKLFAVLPLILGFCLMFMHETKWLIRVLFNRRKNLAINTQLPCGNLEGEVEDND